MMVNIKIIQQQGQSALVEWLEKETLQRTVIPLEVINDEQQVSQTNLKRGILYGLKWSEIVKLSATSERLEQQLRRVGIWTAEDALGNAEKVLGAIQATYQIDLGRIMQIAKREGSK